MHRTDKEGVVTELVERLRSTESLIVADYRGLTNAQLVELRSKLRASGAQLKVVKNTLTRRAAEEAGAESLLALLEGPTAIAFVEAEGDPVGVAKALADTARDTKVLALRGGMLSGRSIGSDEIEELAKLPSPEIVKSQLVGVIIAPLTQLLGLITAPVRDLVGLIDARVAQLDDSAGDSAGAESLEEPIAPEAAVVDSASADSDEGIAGDAANDDSEDADHLVDSATAESTEVAADDATAEEGDKSVHLVDSASAESTAEEE